MKPINHIIDGGTPFLILKSYLEAYSEYISFLKLAWGSSLLDPEFMQKKKLCEALNIIPILGGTFFEYCYHRDDLTLFTNKLLEYKMEWVELSRGTVDIDNNKYCNIVSYYSDKFNVMSEIGRKCDDNSEQLTTKEWLDHSHLSLKAGATIIVLESRESGKVGIADNNGVINAHLIRNITSEIDKDLIIFEAPLTNNQSSLITNLGVDVNLGNIPIQGILPVQALRNKLRSDTLLLE